MSDSVGSVSVEVVPDARGWSQKLQSQLRDQKVEIKADADTTEAETKLDEAARTRTAKIKTDTSDLSKGATKLDSFVSNLGLIPTLALTAGSALIPLAAAIGGVTAAIAAPLLIAGGGVGLFGVLAGFAAKQTTEQLKNIDKLSTKLGTLTKGTAEYKQAQKELAAAQSALTPAQTQFGKSLDNVKSSFQGLLSGKNGQALLGPLSTGLDLLAKVLPLLSPIIQAASGALTDLLGSLGDAVSGPGFQKFVNTISKQVGPDIIAFGHIGGNAIKGLTGFITGLGTSLGGGVLSGLEKLSGHFADLGQNAKHSKALQDFADYFHKNGPGVASALGAVARTLGHVVQALAPLGPVVLTGIKDAANALSKIPIPVLTALAGATAGLVAFGKLGGFKGTAFAINKLTGGKGVAGGVVGGTSIVPVRVVGPVEVIGATPGGGAVPTGGGLSTGEKVGAELAAGATFAAKIAKFGEFVGRFGEIIGAPAFVGTGGTETGNHPVPGGESPNIGTPFVIPKGGLPTSLPGLKSTGTQLDSLRQQAANASRSIDLIGPRAANTSATAVHALGKVVDELNLLGHPYRVLVVAETAAAIKSLEALQNYRIHDKSFTVYQRNLTLDRSVGPGGGAGRPATNGSGGPQSGSSHGASGTPVHIHLDENGRTTLTGYMHGQANDVYQANQRYDDARHGR